MTTQSLNFSSTQRWSLTLFLIAITLMSFAGGGKEKSRVITRAIHISSSFQKAEIWGNVQIILTGDVAGKIVFTGREKNVNRISTTVNDKKLKLDVPFTQEEIKTKVYIPVAFLNHILVNGDALITSEGLIAAEKLEIVLNGNSSVKIKSAVGITVKADEGYELINQ